jgi:hypothetical protein
MQIHSQVLKCTVFVGVKTPTKEFIPIGTGFICNHFDEELAFGYTITCRHVLDQCAFDSKGHERSIYIRFNTKDGSTRDIKTSRSSWVDHKDKVDASIIPVDSSWDSDDQLDSGPLTDSAFMTAEKAAQVGFSLGDELFIAGLFVGHPGEKKNVPIVRVAHVSAMPGEPIWMSSPRRPAYLVETKSLGGTSGSPVFLNLQPMRYTRGPIGRIDEKMSVLPYLLIGMIQGSHGGDYSAEFVEDRDGNKISPDREFNAGISVTVPSEQIVEILGYDEMKKERLAVIEEKKRRIGYRPSGADESPSREEAGDNPSHREDFTSLLNAAAKTKLQDDQT